MSALLASRGMHIYVANPDYGVDKKTRVCTEARRHADALLAKSKTLMDMREFYDSFRKVIAGDSVDDPDTWIDKYSK